MKKRILLLVVCILTIALSLTLFAACDDDKTSGGTENGGTENGGTENGGTENGGTGNGGTENGGTENGGEVTPPATYTVTFKADGATVGTVDFTAGAQSVTEPGVPAKQCFAGAWESYTLGNENITVNAVYTLSHSALVNVSAAEPQCNLEGNIDYYSCSGCDKFFSDAAGETEIADKSSVVISTVDCSFVDGYCKWCNSKQLYVRDGQKITFGSYPQSEVTDDALKAALNVKAGTLPTSANAQNWTSYGYYINGSASNYMWYIDVVDGADKYRGVYFISYRPFDEQKTSSSGNSHQDDHNYSTGVVYWFKFEPITWTILSENTADGTALILCDMIIDSQAYDSGTIYNSNYESSTIRRWLNRNFYNTAFDDLSKQIIKTTVVDNSVGSTGSSTNSNACPNTEDKVFLLSYSDVKNSDYGFSSIFTDTDTVRQKNPTDYAFVQGASSTTNQNVDGTCGWWLRSPHNNGNKNVRFVAADGSLERNTSVYYTSYGVVPAIQIIL